MKKHKIPKSSFLYKFSMRFLLLILVPFIICWLIFIEAMNFFYTDKQLNAQQISLENSISSLENSLNATSNAITALESNTEIIYYLDYYSNKPEMLYSLKKNIHSFCESLYSMSPYLSNIRIYSDSPILLYSMPFEKLEEIPLDEEELSSLLSSKPQETIWKIAMEADNAFPTICRYQKFYAFNYSKVIGYIELQISPVIFQDYFDFVKELTVNKDSCLALYHKGSLIYSNQENTPPTFNDAEIQNTYSVNYWKKTYTNYLIIPTLDFTLLHMGDLNDLNTIEGNTMLFIISAVIIILLMLIILFFSSVTSLSMRILDFSSFIQHSDTNNLTSYQLTNRDMSNFDELTLLIKTYNEMITENNALISKVQKMELLSQNARFQALQAQIHPHFIYGTLETIRMTALQNKDKEAASMIFSLSALIRYSISISKSVTLKDEIDIATHYLTIQKIRFSERLEYQFSIDENLLCLQIPAFVLQPILENAIIYGISQTLDACHLFVHVSTSDHTLTLKIGNSGLPISDERLFEVNELLSGTQKIESFHGRQNGLALNNIRERLLIFYHGNASIYMTREENFTNTVITIQDYQNFLEKGTESHVFDSYCR